MLWLFRGYMYEVIKNFHQQFEYQPKIENQERLLKREKFIVVGMGGSHLAAGLLKAWQPQSEIIIHRDYGLPALSDKILKESLIVISSYSGNTEEVIDAFYKAREKKLSLAAISCNGRLIDLAKETKTPYVQLPKTDLAPRLALGHSLMALLKITGKDKELKEAGALSNLLNPAEAEGAGRSLGKKLKGFIPIIYSSLKNKGLGYVWKAIFNETDKIPSFINVFPELNHSEMAGFNPDSLKKLCQNFYFIALKDSSDEPRIIKRMEAFKNLFGKNGLIVETIELQGLNQFHKIFSSVILAEWTGYYLAKEYGFGTEAPIIEEFKKLIATRG